MNVTTIPLAVLGFQYKIARLPLQLIENRVVARMDAETPARLLYERSLGAMDAAVGKILGDAGLEKRGEALAQRSDALMRAARLDAAAAQKEERAAADLKRNLDDAADKSRQARESADRNIQQARTEAEQRKHNAAQAAAQQAQAGKHQADEVAARRRSSVDEATREAQESIRVREDKAGAAAESTLDGAQAKQAEADQRRARAERVEQLADIEKQKRQTAARKS